MIAWKAAITSLTSVRSSCSRAIRTDWRGMSCASTAASHAAWSCCSSVAKARKRCWNASCASWKSWSIRESSIRSEIALSTRSRYTIPPPLHPPEQPIPRHGMHRIVQTTVYPELIPGLRRREALRLLPQQGEDALAHGPAGGLRRLLWRLLRYLGQRHALLGQP